MGDFEKILSLQTFCDNQVLCSKCPLKNIDGEAGCCGCIEDWDDEKVERAYKMVFEEEKVLKEFLVDRRVVELRNGERYLIVGDFLMGENNFFILKFTVFFIQKLSGKRYITLFGLNLFISRCIMCYVIQVSL